MYRRLSERAQEIYENTIHQLRQLIFPKPRFNIVKMQPLPAEARQDLDDLLVDIMKADKVGVILSLREKCERKIKQYEIAGYSNTDIGMYWEELTRILEQKKEILVR